MCTPVWMIGCTVRVGGSCIDSSSSFSMIPQLEPPTPDLPLALPFLPSLPSIYAFLSFLTPSHLTSLYHHLKQTINESGFAGSLTCSQNFCGLGVVHSSVNLLIRLFLLSWFQDVVFLSGLLFSTSLSGLNVMGSDIIQISNDEE
jgi:hypothetical protein